VIYTKENIIKYVTKQLKALEREESKMATAHQELQKEIQKAKEYLVTLKNTRT
jgi:hypothetical protein